MPAETLLLLVEGPHDLEFCARLLKPSGFHRIQRFEQLSSNWPFWRKLVPTDWPQGGDLLARHPVPAFFENRNRAQTVAIVNAVGDSKLVSKLAQNLAILDQMPASIGIVLDADSQGSPTQRYTSLRSVLAARLEPEMNAIVLPPQPGSILQGPPRFGVFILPDNRSSGTLEDLLLEAGMVAYPALQEEARSFISRASVLAELDTPDLVDLNKPAGRSKAISASMASVLKPGKAIQVSIQDNRWLDGAALDLPRLAVLRQFLDELLN